tara:strand:- start:13688 stop:15013 length:1326 start_codon:yes stop_codon:yes gene_type:complete
VLKILVVNDVFPHIKNRTTILFKNIVPIIKKTLDVKIFWIITDDYGERLKNTNPDYEISYLSDFNNAREVLEKIKPDLSYHLIGNSIMDYAFMEAERALNIPNFGFADAHYVLAENKDEVVIGDYFRDQTSRKKIFLENSRQFFEKTNLGSENDDSIRGKNFLKKCYFLIKTLRSIGKSHLQVSKILFQLFKLLYLTPPRNFNQIYNCDLIFTESKSGIDYLELSGLKRENIHVVGNPVFDNAFEKRNQSEFSNNSIPRVLFITANLGSGQGKSDFTKSRRDQMINETISGLQRMKKELSLMIKIHPTAENYTEFKKFTEKSKNIQISQEDDIIELLNKTDIVITPVTSTAAIIALIMKKPIILWNYFHVEEDLLLRKNVVLECNSGEEIASSIDAVKSFTENNSEKIREFIDENFSYGNSSKRIVEDILDFIKEHNMQTN